jgi:hypothetical protein
MSDRPPVLVLGNDLSPVGAKMVREICLALGRLGRRAVGRDTRLIRWAAAEVVNEDTVRREAYETGVAAKWNKFIFDYGFDTVIGLNLDWLFSTQLFVDDAQVKQIHSFWLDDVRNCLQSTQTFSLGVRTLLDVLNKLKVSHHCCFQRQAEELRQLGVERITLAESTPLNLHPSQMGSLTGSYWEEQLKRVLQ